MFSSLLGRFLELKALGQRIFLFLVSFKRKITVPDICQSLCHYTRSPAMHENSSYSALTGHLIAQNTHPQLPPWGQRRETMSSFYLHFPPSHKFFPFLALPISLICAFVRQDQGGRSSVLPLALHHTCKLSGSNEEKETTW